MNDNTDIYYINRHSIAFALDIERNCLLQFDYNKETKELFNEGISKELAEDIYKNLEEYYGVQLANYDVSKCKESTIVFPIEQKKKIAKTIKRNKKQFQIQKIKYELSLLLPALSFLTVQYKRAVEADSSEDDDFMVIIKKIINKIRTTTSVYRQYHIEVVDDINEVFERFNENNLSFLVALSLIIFHHELQGKKISIGQMDNVNKLAYNGVSGHLCRLRSDS